jgi:hypothetical protein
MYPSFHSFKTKASSAGQPAGGAFVFVPRRPGCRKKFSSAFCVCMERLGTVPK